MGKDLGKSARKGDLNQIKKILDSGKVKIDDLDKDQKSALHHAIEGEQLAAASLLLEKGANINLKTPIGDTPIILSLKLAKSSEKQEDITVLLVNKGADLDIESKERKTYERYLEILPRRVQIRFKEAQQIRLRTKQINVPTGKQSPLAKPMATNTPSPISIGAGGPVNTTPSLSPISQPTTTTTTITTPTISNINKPISSVTPPITPSIFPTVQNNPMVQSSNVVRPPQLDIITPKTLLGEEFSQINDVKSIWLEVAYRTSVVAMRSEKVRYDDMTKSIDDCGNTLVHLLSIIGNSETTSFIELPRNQDSVSSIQERVKNLREGISMRLFSRIDHIELIRLTAAFVGSLHWMYYCWSEVTQDDINRSIAECALSCRSAMTAASTSTQIPITVLTNICKLISNISIKLFITRSPLDGKKISDSLQSIASTFKSLMALTQIQIKSPDNIITMGKSIAEQLSLLKQTSIKLLPSRVGVPLNPIEEQEISETASRQLKQSIDYFKTRRLNTNQLSPTLKERLLNSIQNIQTNIEQFSLFTSQNKDSHIVVLTQLIAQEILELKNILQIDYIQSRREQSPPQPQITEEFSDQISNVINCLFHLVTQLLFTISAITAQNRIADFSQVEFSLANISSCCCIILDSFCF